MRVAVAGAVEFILRTQGRKRREFAVHGNHRQAIFGDTVVTDIEGVLEEEFGEDSNRINQYGRDAVGNLRSTKKNPLYVAAVIKGAWDQGKRFPVLEKVVEAILK